MPSDQPTLQQLKDWLGLPPEDEGDDLVLQRALDSALAAQARIVQYPADEFGEEFFTDDLSTAIFLRATRTASRRNSPEFVVGLAGTGGDFVSAQVPPVDVDVAKFEGSYMRIVSA